MHFNITHPPTELPPAPPNVEIGNVYPAKGGRGDTRYWVVISIRGTSATVLGLDSEGAVTSGQTYGTWAFRDRPLLGHCAGLETMTFDIEWEPKP